MSAIERELKQGGAVNGFGELAFCRQVFEKASEGIMYYPLNGDRVSMVNEACARMHGYSREEMRDMKLQDLDVADLTQLTPPRRQRLLAGEHLTFEAEHYHRDGHTFPLEVSSTLIAGYDFILEFQRDITDRKKTAEEILKKRVFESLGALAGGIAHHLNNLLQGLIGYISMAKLYTHRTSQAFELLKKAEGCHTTALQLKDQLANLATGGPAVWETMASGDLFREFALSSPGSRPVKAAPDRADLLSVSREKEAAEPVASNDASPAGVRILIMDDEPAVLEVATEFLQYVGYRVDGVVNGDEAIQAYQRAVESGDPYGAVILDLFIDAGMGGQEAKERLCEIDPQVKVIISSGNSSDPLVTNYADYGFAASLLKPYRLERLETMLARLL